VSQQGGVSFHYVLGSLTRVGAIRRFFGCELSSFSLSLASRLTPAVGVGAGAGTVLPLLGVSGGVVMGTPVTLPELAAAMLGTVPPMRGGLVKTALEACVAIEEVLFERAGDEGLMLTNDALFVGGGEGAAKELEELRCWCVAPGKGEGGAKDVGVGVGVAWLDDDAVPADVGFFVAAAAAHSPLYTCPNSPGLNDMVEQNPSEDEINKVRPSLDLTLLVSTHYLLVSTRVYLPCQVSKRGQVQITDNAYGGHLLGIVKEDRVLGGNGIYHAIWQGESRLGARGGRARLQVQGL
jgi:hypothetical protein